MSKKILTVLAPVAAIVAFMAIPTMAQATTAQAPAGTALAAGAAVQGTVPAGNLTTEIQGVGNLVCTGSDMAGNISSNGGAHVTGTINNETFTGCTGPLGSSITIVTNAPTENWTLQAQQPLTATQAAEANTAAQAAGSATDFWATGDSVLHVTNPKGVVQFTAQAKIFGIDVGTCDVSTPSIQLRNPVGTNSGIILGTTSVPNIGDQFEVQSGPENVCGAKGTKALLKGTFVLTSGGNAVTLDMT